MALNDLLTVSEVALLSRLSGKTVYRAIHCGELRASKLRGQWRIRWRDYEDWVRRGAYVPRDLSADAPVPAPPAQGSRAALRQIESEAA